MNVSERARSGECRCLSTGSEIIYVLHCVIEAGVTRRDWIYVGVHVVTNAVLMDIRRVQVNLGLP